MMRIKANNLAEVVVIIKSANVCSLILNTHIHTQSHTMEIKKIKKNTISSSKNPVLQKAGSLS